MVDMSHDSGSSGVFNRILEEQLGDCFLMNIALDSSMDQFERPRNQPPYYDEIPDFNLIVSFASDGEGSPDSNTIRKISLYFTCLYYMRILKPETTRMGFVQWATSPHSVDEGLMDTIAYPFPSLCMSTSSDLLLTFLDSCLPLNYGRDHRDLAHYVLVVDGLSFECIGHLEVEEQ